MSDAVLGTGPMLRGRCLSWGICHGGVDSEISFADPLSGRRRGESDLLMHGRCDMRR